MQSILLSTILVSFLHALIPSHWLPLISFAKQYNWTKKETLWATFYMGLAHVLSTIIIGITISYIGLWMSKQHQYIFEIAAPIALVVLGIFFIYRHYTHHHFHLTKTVKEQSKFKLLAAMVLLMFLSPCFEVEAFFLAAGSYGIGYVLLLSAIYAVVSIAGMLVWVNVALQGLKKMNWHKIEHNAGLITGFVLILCGIFTYFIH